MTWWVFRSPLRVCIMFGQTLTHCSHMFRVALSNLSTVATLHYDRSHRCSRAEAHGGNGRLPHVNTLTRLKYICSASEGFTSVCLRKGVIKREV